MTGHEAGSRVTTGADTSTHDAHPASGAPALLSLTGVSRDGAALLLTDEAGSPFLLDVTPRLRAALRGDAHRIGKVETTMDSTLRPRDIQARIRAGETAEEVAEAAQTSIEKIMVFAGPVLAEREHVAQRAQHSSLRRRAGEPAGTTRTLGDAVDAHLRAANVDPGSVTWDAWRREDGRWSLVADFELSVRTGSAHFTFDAPGNYVMLEDDDARWLVGEVATAAPEAPAHDDLHEVRERRLTALAPEELALGDDAIDLVHQEPVAEETLPLEAFFDDAPQQPAAPQPPEGPTVDPEPDPEPPAPRRPVQKKKGRASVPSWDEIMFGGDSDSDKGR
jgi:hypothetical protein